MTDKIPVPVYDTPPVKFLVRRNGPWTAPAEMEAAGRKLGEFLYKYSPATFFHGLALYVSEVRGWRNRP